MSEYGPKIDPRDLDNYITGHYGEDQFKGKEREFDRWLEKVDEYIGEMVGGLSSADLPDVCYRDWFEDGVKPRTAACRAVKNVGGD